MDIRLIFLDYNILYDGMTEKVSCIDWWFSRMKCKDVCVGKSAHYNVEVRSVSAVKPCFQEKFLSQILLYPYRKRTHVGEERIHRRARKLLLRNSAKLPRNFGIRGTLSNKSRR